MIKTNQWPETVAAAGSALLLVAASTPCSGQSADALAHKLVEKGVLTQQEADELRKEADQDYTKAYRARSNTPSWINNITFSGDFRLRMDDLWPESGLSKPERLRFRLRLRYGGVWEATDWATIGFRLGSGDERSSGGDGSPNSNNQTFTHFFSKKPLFLDAAYVTLHPPDLNWISITGGKMNKILFEPGFNSPLVYDPDLTPEGAVAQLNYKFGPHDQFQLIGNVAGFVLDELSGSTGDAYLLDGQAGIKANLLGDPKSPEVKATLVGGYLVTRNLSGIPISDTSGNTGNSTMTGGASYLANFDVVYGRGELAWTLCDEPFLGAPSVITFGSEYDQNLNSAYDHVYPSPGQTTAWATQVGFGGGSKRGQWLIAYEFKHLEADAVLDSLTDDDFGGTDREGHVLKAYYNIRDWWTIGATAFYSEKISDRPNSGHNQSGFNGRHQTRLFLDTMFKF